MSALHQADYLSEEEYLAFDQASTFKHKLIDHEIYVMAGAGTTHNRITATLTRHLGNHLDGLPYEVFAPDMKLTVQTDFLYPDVMVVCNHSDTTNGISDDARIIIEVLSKSTRKIDPSIKPLRYQRLPNLQEYVLIETDFVAVEICRKVNHWRSERYYFDDAIYFAAIDLTLSVKHLYARIAFD